MKALKLTLRDVLAQGRESLIPKITGYTLYKMGVGQLGKKYDNVSIWYNTSGHWNNFNQYNFSMGLIAILTIQ